MMLYYIQKLIKRHTNWILAIKVCALGRMKSFDLSDISASQGLSYLFLIGAATHLETLSRLFIIT
jgi:hypothetical protein